MLQIRYNFIIIFVISFIYFFFFNYLQILYVLLILIFLHFGLIPEEDIEEDFEDPEGFSLPFLQYNLKTNVNDKNIIFLRKYLQVNKDYSLKRLCLTKSFFILNFNKNYFLKNLSKNNFYSVLKLLYYNKFKIMELASNVYNETTNLFYRKALDKFFFNKEDIKYNPKNIFKDLKKDFKKLSEGDSDLAFYEISLIRNYFLDEIKTRDSNQDSDTFFYLKKKITKRKTMSYPSYTEDFFDVDFFNGKIARQLGINFYNLTNSSISFNKRKETNIKKILRKEAEAKYAEKLAIWKENESEIEDYPPFVFDEKRMFTFNNKKTLSDKVLYFYEDNLDVFANNFLYGYSTGIFFDYSFRFFFSDLMLKHNKKYPKLHLDLKNNSFLLFLKKEDLIEDPLSLNTNYSFIFSYRTLKWFLNKKRKGY